MKACPILIPFRGLRLRGGLDFGGDYRDNQRSQRQERHRWVFCSIPHGHIHGNPVTICGA